MNVVIVGLLITLACSFPAYAHDPGLSLAELSITENELVAQLRFARRDIEAAVPMDTDHDGAISSAEYVSAHPRLQALAHRAIDIQANEQRIVPQAVKVKLDQADGLRFQLGFPTKLGSKFRVSVPILAELPQGHRQHLTVQGKNGDLTARHVLSSDTAQVAVQMQPLNAFHTLVQYVIEGTEHIWIGFDHILFLLTLMLPAVLVYRDERWQSVNALKPAVVEIAKIVTAFTIAHSLTLSLAALKIVNLPPQLVEPAIAMSVLVAAVNNLNPIFPGSRWMLTFVFGLLHGFGFANVLVELGLSTSALLLSLVAFNVGVEIGQLAIVLMVFPIAYALRDTHLYKRWVFRGGSMTAAGIAGLWLVERIFDYKILGL